MKLNNKNLIKTFLTGMFIFIINFSNAQSALVQEESQKIIGTWIVDGEPTNKWIFMSNNICKWELDGAILSEFTYSISSEFSPNGLEHTYLKLINVNQPSEVCEYAINSIGSDKMTLETFEPKVGYTHYTKQ